MQSSTDIPPAAVLQTGFVPSKERSERPELLSPAGDWDAMRAAVQNGADAVYFGLSDFNARHRATNFTAEELPKVVAYLHEHNVRGYVTCNTLIFSEELPQIAELILQLNAAGVDAVIVQDLGLVRLVRHLTPELTVHGSTQMTITDSRGVEFAKSWGVERVILARELSVLEIGKIRKQVELPVEVFVHGALCVAYSGQCLTSESLGGRSANRGQCAQACRLPYDLIVDGTVRELGDLAYLLSPQDLAAPDLIDDLVRAGVTCFKIEGRLKSAQYVAATTQTYRVAVDAALAKESFKLSREQLLTLQQSFSRGFSHGFLSGVDHQELVQGRFPKSRGVKIGRVINRTAYSVIVELDAQHAAATEIPLKPGDGIVFDEGHPDQEEQGGRLYEVKQVPLRNSSANRCVELGFRGGDLSLVNLSQNCLVWKTDDPALRKKLEQTYQRDQVHHRTKINAYVHAVIGEPLEVEFRDEQGRTGKASSAQPLEAATRQPVNLELLKEQLGRLGDTPFELQSVALNGVAGDVPPGGTTGAMVPKSVLNEVRRLAISRLSEQRLRKSRVANPSALEQLRNGIKILGGNFGQVDQISRFSVLVRSIEQLQTVLSWTPAAGSPGISLVHCDFEDVRRYATAVALCREHKVPVSLATLRIVKPNEDGWLRQIGDHRPDYVLVRNTSALRFYRERFPELQQLGDYSLNVSNELTAALLMEEGLERLVPSYDLNWQQLQDLLRNYPPACFESVVHQHMPMFHMEHCVFCHTLSEGKDYRDCGRPCDTHQVDLRDRVGEKHPLVADVGCRNTLFNAHAQSAAEYIPRMQQLGLRWFRVELLRESRDATIELLQHYSNTIAGKAPGRSTFHQLQVLNHLGVTRGPLGFE